MKYNLFLFDLDDTLLDFQASEKLCFTQTFLHFGVRNLLEEIHAKYKIENNLLWKQLERGEVDKDFLKIERFKRTLDFFKLEIDPALVSDFYLEQLPLNVVLIDGAVEILKFARQFGEIGIITNGIEVTQRERIKNSDLKNYIDFLAVSEACGFAKPDIRFFEYAVKKAKVFEREKTIIVGDRLEADILGGRNFSIDTCWFNPEKIQSNLNFKPDFEIQSLRDFEKIMEY